jgi:hypothetical protein
MTVSEVRTWAIERMRGIEKAPEMWGGLEAVEMQYLTVLDALDTPTRARRWAPLDDGRSDAPYHDRVMLRCGT